MTKEGQDWRELCAAVAKEQDRVKLLALMEELLAVLEERESPKLAGGDRPFLAKGQSRSQ
jgi:hypothetical protein